LHELFKHPLEVGKGIGTLAADLFYEGINHGTSPTSVRAANEHPVLVSELGWSYCERHDHVLVAHFAPSIKFDLPIDEAGFKVG
jgi:hypothetical protein